MKRKESADSASEKKVKFEEDTEMDGYSSYSSRRSGTRHVEVEGKLLALLSFILLKKKLNDNIFTCEPVLLSTYSS